MQTQTDLDFNDVFNTSRKNLLDMGLRNNLLNFKEVKRTISIVDEDIGELFNILVLNKNKMEFLPKKDNKTITQENETIKTNDDNSVESSEDTIAINASQDFDDKNIWQMPIDLDNIPEEHKDLFLQTSLTENELQKRLFSLLQYYNSSIEESGYNNLFLALGFLEWKQVDSEESFIKAPLMLIPVDLSRRSVDAPFTINWSGEDISLNISLKHKLLDQGINLPAEDNITSREDVYNYLNKVKKAIKSKNDWSVTNDMYLSTFNFKKFVMYKDLDLENWSTNIENGELGRIFGLKEADNYESFDVENIDKNLQPIETFNVLDADSSQIAVIEDAKKGHSLVVEGPPGTGKSQTIVNLIAELLANNKKILFVSEKKAALDVVKTRMNDIGLGKYCLGLYDNKVRSKQFLNDLNTSLMQDKVALRNKDSYDKLSQTRKYLNDYMEVIESNYGDTDLSIYDLIGMYESNYQKLEKSHQEVCKIDIPSLKQSSSKERNDLLGNIDKIAHIYELIAPINENPWKYTNMDYLSPNDVDDIKRQTKDISNFLEIIVKNINTFSDKTDLEKVVTLKDVPEYVQAGKLLLDNMNYQEDKDVLKQLSLAIENYNTHYSFNVNEYDFNIDDIKNEFVNLTNNQSERVISQNILVQCNASQILSQFKIMKENIRLCSINHALKDPDILQKFYKFKSNINTNAIKKFFNKDYKNSKKELTSYYDMEVEDEQILSDFEELFSWNDTLNNLRNKILPYASFNKLTDEQIIYELRELISNNQKLAQINEKVANVFNVTGFNTPDELEYHLDLLANREELLNFIKKHDNLAKKYFKTWNGLNTNISEFKTEYNDLTEFLKKQSMDKISITDSDTKEDLKEQISTIDYAYIQVIKGYDFLNGLLKFTDKLASTSYLTLNFNDFKTEIEKINANITTLNDWNQFNSYCREYSNEYTQEMIELIKEDKIQPDSISVLFEYNLANNMLNEVYEENDILMHFNSSIYEDTIDQFKQLDKKTIELNRYRVQEILDETKPSMSHSVSPMSTLGILLHEMNKKRNFKPIRKLLTECRDVICDIKPCFLMSPLSIAQYLDTYTYENYFDYIIFDEASQVKVEDAIGALLRGKYYVIMGDTKQLPPTSFFDVETNIESDDESIQIQDVESILHLCRSALPYKMLKYHYRSRHESLIAVSNEEFYNNGLLIFPSASKEDEELGLKFEYNPNSVYDRGKSSRNMIEATDVVNYVLNHYKKYGDKKSLGVGTFSMQQRQAILEALEVKLKENPQLEKYFNRNDGDSFFVKNIENIQGDERDVILISIGYGRDRDGKLSLNFGPLNRDGGERRLNVLTTRAKEKCVVFSNFKSSEMQTTPKTPFGVKALKNYLHYAEFKEFPENYHTGADFDSPFEKSVYDFLESKGYTIEKQVGCSGYKIDLAVVDDRTEDNDDSQYLLAIECDGAAYHSSPAARDRDRLRQNILEGLGWQFHRIWSTDWYYNRTSAKETLVNAIEEAFEEKKAKKIEKERIKETRSDAPKINTVEIPVEETKDDKKQHEEVEVIKQEEQEPTFGAEYVYYENTIFCDSFYDLDKHDVLEVIEDIVKMESPIYKEEIYNRLKKVYDVKATKKFKKAVDDLLNSTELVSRGTYSSAGFYLNKDVPIHARLREKPNIDYIYSEEIANAVYQTLAVNYSININDLAKQVSLLFGFKSLSSKTSSKITEIIYELKFNDKIDIDEKETVTLHEEKASN